jgi:hypothetical protein
VGSINCMIVVKRKMKFLNFPCSSAFKLSKYRK